MNELILQPTELAQWHALVSEAQALSTIRLNEETESYLVFLLMRYTEKPEQVGGVLADKYLQGLNHMGEEAKQVLRDVGDSCLLLTGLFPGRVRRRMVKVSYYVNLGQTAYATLSSDEQVAKRKLFSALCDDFVSLMDVLQTFRQLAGEKMDIKPLEAQELWQDTGSKQALKILESYSQGLSIYSEVPDSLKGNG